MPEIKFPIQMYDPSRDYKLYKEEIDKSISTVVESGSFIGGPQVKELETELATFTGAKAISCANGTDALFIVLKALDIGPGDEVITVALTWISSAETISMTGAKPVWVDVKKETFCIDEDLIEAAITPKTKAILVVSLYGYIPDYKKINEIARRHNIDVIEDGAQSFGAERDGYKSCSCAHTRVATTSFFPTKPLGCFGDGGCMFTNDQVLEAKLRAIKSHGGAERFKHKYIGVNSRLDTIQASVLLTKLKHFRTVLSLRDSCANKYSSELSTFATPMNDINIHAWAQYSLILASKEERDNMVKKLKDNGVNVAIFYPIPLYKQECFNDNAHLPITEMICDCIINLPCYAYLTDDEQNFIINLFKK